MKISFTTVAGNLNLNNGYGTAGYNVSSALKRLGHEVPFQDATAPVEIAFCQPTFQEWSAPKGGQYRIQYTPWESTALPDGWLEGFSKADEVWTPSPVIAQWFKEAGVKQDVHVYEHGIEKSWISAARKRTRRDGPLRFLHHGDPAVRKGSQETLDAFRTVFGNSDDVHLTFKSFGGTRVRGRDKNGNRESADIYDNVSIVPQELSPETLVRFYDEFDVMVYPGWGEGFGLIPLQAMATGMPTVCTEAWAPYKNFILPNLRLGSQLVDSPWGHMHPGKMFQPDVEELCQILESVYEDYDKYASDAYDMVEPIALHYDWDELTENAFDHVVQKFTS